MSPEMQQEALAFQSTLPIQGETASFFSFNQHLVISIHSPYTGRDRKCLSNIIRERTFQSTLPIQGETD